MAITPSHLSFNHQINDITPSAKVVNYSSTPYGGNSFVSSESTENWVAGLFENNTSANVKINSNADNLTVGTHVATIKFYNNREDSGGGFTKILIGSITADVVITEAALLTVTPSNLSFGYEFGGTLPASQTATIYSESSWTITETKTWLDVSVTSGSGNAAFVVSVEPTGLSAGTYTENIVITDGTTTRSLPISLVVSEPDTSTDYLYVSPLILSFGYTISGITPPTKRLELNSSDTWTATANQTWVNLLTTTAGAGVATLDIGLHNLSGLTAGNHFADVSIVNGNIAKTIQIELEVYELAQQLLDNQTLYFSEDNNIIEVSSGRTDTLLQIKVSTIYQGESFNLTYNNPFFKGSAKKRIGLEAKKIISDRPFVGIASASLFNPYTPVYLDFEINEKEMFTDTLAQTINIDNVAFIKGERPLNNWMSDLPETIYATKKGMVLFSFLNETDTAINTISVTGAVTQTFTFTNAIELFYTAMVPLDLFALEVGDKITISASDVSINVIIKPEGKEQTFLFWENENGCWDAVEFTGEYSGDTALTQTTAEFRKDYKTTETRVLEVTDQDTHSIYTGFIRTEAEVQTLKKALKATNQYLYKNNVLYNVNSTTKKLPFFDYNDRTANTFKLTFENKEI